MIESVKVAKSRAHDVLVVGVFKPDNKPAAAKGKKKKSTRRPAPSLDAATRALDTEGDIADLLKRPECTGDIAITETVRDDGTRILLLGLGSAKNFDPFTLQRAAAIACKRIDAAGGGRVRVELAGPAEHAGMSPTRAGQVFAETAGLLTFDTYQFKGSASNRPNNTSLSLASDHKEFHAGMTRGVALATSTNLARRVSQTPPNICNPAWVASEARALAREFDSISVTVIKGERLEKERLRGHINVGQASESEPMLIRIAYTPPRKSSAKPAVLVGKTITYDSGGLSIKGPSNMAGMKRDMDGGAAVLGAMHAIASTIKPNKPVVALLAAAENSISDEAYRPDDVIEFRNGVTVEITNTDAEGRLVLADALCWAEDKEKPDFIVDLATLTGGVVVALGSTYAGMWCDNDELRARVESASDASAERVWRLPLHQEYKDLMRSDCADILNSSPNRKAHPIQGPAFLSYFVKDSTPWCHLDIAGVHALDSESGPYAKGTATGWGVRLLAELLDQ